VESRQPVIVGDDRGVQESIVEQLAVQMASAGGSMQ